MISLVAAAICLVSPVAHALTKPAGGPFSENGVRQEIMKSVREGLELQKIVRDARDRLKREGPSLSPAARESREAAIKAKTEQRDLAFKKAFMRAIEAWEIEIPQGTIQSGPMRGEPLYFEVVLWDGEAGAVQDEVSPNRFRKITPNQDPTRTPTVWPNGMLSLNLKELEIIDAGTLAGMIYGATIRAGQLLDPATATRSKHELDSEVWNSLLGANEVFDGVKRGLREGRLTEDVANARREHEKWKRRWRKEYVGLGRIDQSNRRDDWIPELSKIKEHQERLALHIRDEAEAMRDAEEAAERWRDAVGGNPGRVDDLPLAEARSPQRSRPPNRGPATDYPLAEARPAPRAPRRGQASGYPVAETRPSSRPPLKGLARRACASPGSITQADLDSEFSWVANGDAYSEEHARGLSGCVRELFLELLELNRTGTPGIGIDAEWLNRRARELQPPPPLPPPPPPPPPLPDDCIYEGPRCIGGTGRGSSRR